MSGHEHPKESYAESQLTLAEFMQQNLENDPDFFVEPEDTADYGPPGMPTPFVPMDARIADRQLAISDQLRGLILDPRLREFVGQDTIDMLLMNFDSHNTILGVTNNGSYYRWSHQEGRPALPDDLHDIEDRAVLGLAGPGEILDLLLHSDDEAEDLKSGELFKLYHPAKYRMRHLEPRRQEVKQAIHERGGQLFDSPEFYDLKLFPYVVVTNRELTDEERRECHLLVTSAEKKMKLLTSETIDTSLMTQEVFDEITAEIHRDSYRVGEIMASTQLHTIKGLMASVKRRVGVIEKDDDRDLRIVERQVFAVDVSGLSGELIEALHDVRAARDENEDKKVTKPGKPVVDERTVAAYAWVYEEFKADSSKILPVSTAAYAHEKRHEAAYSEPVTAALARVAINASSIA